MEATTNTNCSWAWISNVMNLFSSAGVGKYRQRMVRARILKYEGGCRGYCLLSPSSIIVRRNIHISTHWVDLVCIDWYQVYFQLIKRKVDMKLKYLFPFFIAMLALMTSCDDEASMTLLDEIQVSPHVSIPV